MNTRDTLIRKSTQLFCESNFHWVGIDRIVQYAGVSKASFYNHFNSKEHLLAAVLEKWSESWKAWFKDRITTQSSGDSIEQLRSIFSAIEDSLKNPHHRGCLLLCTSFAFAPDNDPIYHIAKTCSDEVRGIIFELAESAGIHHPYEFAQQFHMVMQGAIVSEATSRCNRSIEAAAKLANHVIDSFLDVGV